MKTHTFQLLLAACATCPIAYGGPETVEDVEPDESNSGGWCEWLDDSPGKLYENKKNPWIQSLEIGGRFHYQISYQDGTDVNGRDYNDTYDEYRRFRLETKVRFLQFFELDLDANLVDDRRFRNGPDNDLDWGYDDFNSATIGINLDKFIKDDPFEKLELVYGAIRLPITEERRQSSNEIYTIERSLLSNRLSGENSSPTGLMLEVETEAWAGVLGVFSAEDDSDFIGGWNDGQFYLASLTWKPKKDFSITMDYVLNDADGTDDALGYQSAFALGTTYEEDRWGIIGSWVYGDNGFGDPTDSDRNRANRQGDFYGVTVMPWYWLVEEKLQLVFRYEYVNSQESEGIQLTSRYVRGSHDDATVDVNNGRGDLYQAYYLGLNYHLCGNNAKVMGGVLYEDLNTPGGDVDAITYTLAFRTYF